MEACTITTMNPVNGFRTKQNDRPQPELRQMAQRRVLLMRHAQSIPNAPTDFERTLTNQGKSDAKKVPSRIRSHGWIPNRILVSSSRRTMETVELLAEYNETPTEPKEELYLAPSETVLEFMESTRSDETLLLVTHNPGCEVVLYQITGIYHEMTPGACAFLSESNGRWVCERVLRPNGVK